MTTPTRTTTSNKTALRASLKKEDDSLAERLVAADAPLVAHPSPKLPPLHRSVRLGCRCGSPQGNGRPATKKPAANEPCRGRPSQAGCKRQQAGWRLRKPLKAAKAAAKAATSVQRKLQWFRQLKSEGGQQEGRCRESSRARPAKPAKPQGKVEAVEFSAAGRQARKLANSGRRSASLKRRPRRSGDKLVRYSVELLKSEAAAIEAVRAELSKAAGWAASKSDILRAGARLFAEQKARADERIARRTDRCLRRPGRRADWVDREGQWLGLEHGGRSSAFAAQLGHPWPE
jgi:hypothetical protein